MADFDNDLVHESLLHSASFRYSQPLGESKLAGLFRRHFLHTTLPGVSFHICQRGLPQPDFLIAPL